MTRLLTSVGLAFVLCSAVPTGVCVAAETDLDVGTIQLPDRWTEKRTGTKDSRMGEIARPDRTLVVHYDIGFSAGTHMAASICQKMECVWYREQMIDGHRASIGLVMTDAGRELRVTILDPDLREFRRYPANFWAQVRNEEDVADTLLIAMSYKAAP